MSHTYNPTPAPPPASYTHVDDGDADSVALLDAQLEAIEDALEHRHFGAGEHQVVLGVPLINQNSRWTYDETNRAWVQTDITSAGLLLWPVAVPPTFPGDPTGEGGRITELHVRVDGNAGPGAGTHGALPALPQIKFWRRDGATVTQLGSTTVDGSGTVGAYETAHNISITGLTESILATRSYWVSVEGESGGNALPDELQIERIWIVVTAP